MKYIKETICQHIIKDSQKHNGVLKFILPSYPSELLLMIGRKLEEQFSRMVEHRVRLAYGIAYKLGMEWQEWGTDKDRANFTEINSKGWYNKGNNLTELRHEFKTDDEDCLVILMAGYDHIGDQASLLDFYHLDQQSVWELCLRKNFKGWVQSWSQNIMDPQDDKVEIEKIAEVFKTLYDHGLTGLLGVSDCLESIELNGISGGNEAYRLVLNSLSAFKLPSMIGLTARYAKKKTFNAYVTPALEFFNYASFLDSSSRVKAVKKIDQFRKALDDEQVEPEILGCFSIEDLLEALKEYIQDRSIEAREKLYAADFVFITEKILGTKVQSGSVDFPKDKPKKLTGVPPEIFQRALWVTLGDFKKQMRKDTVLVTERIDKITMQSTLFKHDFGDGSDEGDNNNNAQNFLIKILGGIDEYFVDLELGEEHDNKTIPIKSFLCPGPDNKVLSYDKSGTAEPSLKFDVIVWTDDGKKTRREFIWVLPQNHPCYLLAKLCDLALVGYEKSGNALPAFAVPYMSEIFQARDEGEVNRLLAAAMDNQEFSMEDLLKAEGMDHADPVRDLLIDLSVCYLQFLTEYGERGLFKALDSSYDKLRQVYYKTYNTFLENSRVSTLGPLLMKAFMLIPSRTIKENNWFWNEYIEAAVVTPLHPAVLEMLRHQNTFLCDCFRYYIKSALNESGINAFTEKRWNRVVDLARLQWPVFGTLKDQRRVLDTNVRSYHYYHLVGNYRDNSSLITSRLLLEYDKSADDDEITDSELFRETRSSQLIKQVLLDYLTLNPYVDDGINIGAYCGKEIQPLIAGIDSFLAKVLNNRDERQYALKLTIFSDSSDDSSIIGWVNSWRDRWQASEISSGKQHYSNCKISIAYRVVSRGDGFKQFRNLLRDTELDIMFFSEFIDSNDSYFESLGADLKDQDDYRKFPVLEKACCKVIGGGKDKHRERVISNQRFKLGALHAEVMAHIGNKHAGPNDKHVVINCSDYQPWAELVDTAHRSSAWVVCIDPTVDEQLLYRVEAEGMIAREIVGFGTGVGPHGENNYTISTEQFSLVDIKKKVSSQIATKLGPWEHDICEGIADSLIREAMHIAGLSVVKATGPSEYVRDYIAYAMVRKLLFRDASVFCDDIISLDAYRHWFDNLEDSTRPDLLRLQANIVDGYFVIRAQIIECKLAQQWDGYLEKARQQIENGLNLLVFNFRPRHEDRPLGVRSGGKVEDKPDQRYWWMQLHRLIASKGVTTKPKYMDTILALERLSEGYFSITWQAAAVAFWTDLDDDSLQCRPDWDFGFEEKSMSISVASAGRNFIRKACLEGAGDDLFCGISGLSFGFLKPEDASNGDNTRGNEPGKVDNQKGENNKEIVQDEVAKDQTSPTVGDGEQYQPGAGDNNEVPSSGGENTSVVMAKPVPQRILLGKSVAGDKDINWEFGHPDLPNRHLLVFGASGAGKTYLIQALLCELGRQRQNSLVVDYTNGFTNTQLEEIVKEKLNPKQHYIRKLPLTINPFRRQSEFHDDEQFEEDPSDTADRVSGVFTEVYMLGDQQKSALYNAVRDGIIQEGNSFDLNKLINGLDDIIHAGGPLAGPAASAKSKIQPFVDRHPFGQEEEGSWEAIFTDDVSRCHVIQLAGFSKDTARLITEFSLIDLYRYYRGKGSKDNPKVIILDEIQNLDHRLDSPLGQFLTEGRKFGISLVLATQTLSNLNKDERDRLFQASHKLFFKPADTEIRSYAQILSDATGAKADIWIERLSTLKRGECYSLGHALNELTGKFDPNKWFKIRVTALEERF